MLLKIAIVYCLFPLAVLSSPFLPCEYMTNCELCNSLLEKFQVAKMFRNRTESRFPIAMPAKTIVKSVDLKKITFTSTSRLRQMRTSCADDARFCCVILCWTFQ